MPFKDFTAGDILTAADVDNYLMRQSVMTFADAAARDAALVSGIVAEGMVIYLADTNTLQYYDSASWQPVSNPGDITAVTAGAGLSGGGTSGDVTISADYATIGSNITIDNTQVTNTLVSSAASTYTIASSDVGKMLQFTNAVTITIDATTTNFSAGEQVQILADGATLDIVGDGTVTLAGAGASGTALTFSVGNQYEAVAIVGTGSNSYRIIGNVSAA